MSSIHDIVERQREFFYTGETLSADLRLNALNKMYDAISENAEQLMDALKKDLNKQRAEAWLCEIGLLLNEITFAKKHIKSWMKTKRVKTSLSQMPGSSYICPEPYGVTLIMSPWNYPVLLSFSPLIGAIAAGNCAVVKPSAYAENSSACIAQIIRKAFKPEYIAICEGGREENRELLGEHFDYIFFTGSVNVGRTVLESAAKYVTPVTLELGGKSPVIIDEKCDIQLAAKKVAFGKIINAGQTCIAPDYAFVHESVLEEFTEALRKSIKELTGDDAGSMPCIISDKHLGRLRRLLENQNILFGGSIEDKTRQIYPAIIISPPIDSDIMQEEIFGPILPILSYRDIEEPINYIRSGNKPLALYIFSDSKKNISHILSYVSSGGACINDVILHIASPYMPFGGVGLSGMGGYHGKASFDTFSHYRSILKKGKLFDISLRYPPFDEKKFKLAKKILH